MYINKLAGIVNACRSTIKKKAANVKSSTYIGVVVENNDEYCKFEVADHVRISKYKNIFTKDYTPNWSGEVFVIMKVKNTVPRKYVIQNLKGEEVVGKTFLCGQTSIVLLGRGCYIYWKIVSVTDSLIILKTILNYIFYHSKVCFMITDSNFV